MNSLFIPLYMQNYECLKIIKSEDWLENFHSCQFDPLVNSQGAVASRVVLLEDGLVLILHTDTDLSTKNKQTNKHSSPQQEWAARASWPSSPAGTSCGRTLTG